MDTTTMSSSDKLISVHWPYPKKDAWQWHTPQAIKNVLRQAIHPQVPDESVMTKSVRRHMGGMVVTWVSYYKHDMLGDKALKKALKNMPNAYNSCMDNFSSVREYYYIRLVDTIKSNLHLAKCSRASCSS